MRVTTYLTHIFPQKEQLNLITLLIFLIIITIIMVILSTRQSLLDSSGKRRLASLEPTTLFPKLTLKSTFQFCGLRIFIFHKITGDPVPDLSLVNVHFHNQTW